MCKVIIEFKEVKKNYGTRTALDNLEFSIKTKDFVGLVGNNGSGKSTIINILCNVVPYEKGEVKIFDNLITPWYVSYRTRIGVFLSEPILINEFTPETYLRFVCKFQGLQSSESEYRVKEIIDLFRIQHSKIKKINDYSSGDKVKISLAASFIHNPELLILDEPFIHLDIASIETLQNLLLSFQKRKTLFITSHNLDLIYSLCERILIISEGKIIDEIFNSKQLPIQLFKAEIKEKLLNKIANESPKWLV